MMILHSEGKSLKGSKILYFFPLTSLLVFHALQKRLKFLFESESKRVKFDLHEFRSHD